MNSSQRARDAVAGLLMAFSLATAVCFVSNNLYARVEHRDETVAQQSALLHRQPLVFDGNPGDLPEFRNRLMVPLAMSAVTRISTISDREPFLGLRWLTAFICFATLWWFASVVCESSFVVSAFGLTLLALFFTLSFNHPWEHPTDFPDATVMVVAVWAAVTRRYPAAMAVATIGALNRESAAFAGVIWMFVATDWKQRWWLGIAQGAAVAAVALLMTTLIRRLADLPGSNVVNSVAAGDLGAILAVAMRHPFMSWAMMLAAAALVPVGCVLFEYWGSDSGEGRRVAYAGFVVAALSVTIGRAEEIRVLTSAAAILACAAVMLMSQRHSSDAFS
jgi:hypothetical protein